MLSENYFPGWQATLDGRPVKILKANFTYRAVFVPPGIHAVDFEYRPDSFRAGVVASISCIAFSLAVLLFGIFSKKIFRRLLRQNFDITYGDFILYSAAFMPGKKRPCSKF